MSKFPNGIDPDFIKAIEEARKKSHQEHVAYSKLTVEELMADREVVRLSLDSKHDGIARNAQGPSPADLGNHEGIPEEAMFLVLVEEEE